MISAFQLEVTPGADEAALDDLLQNKLGEILNSELERSTRFGRLTFVDVLKSDLSGTNRYIVTVGDFVEGIDFLRAFKDPHFPASLKVTELGSYIRLGAWPSPTPSS